MIIAATGHRPDKLGGHSEGVRRRLRSLAIDYLQAEQPDAVISGMARGWDQAIAEAAIELHLPFIAAVPFEGQAKRWPPESQAHYARLLGQAASIEIVSEFPGARAMQQRNEWMVDRGGKMCALWDGSMGGTFNCIRYAKKVGRPIDNLWPRWANDLRDLLSS
ncbi:DUF1273 family protein [Mesorhizobium sp. AR07]|uniref:SLOG family protein n=1 Tax=Mesorhizobium sp. AR07 TaxID=2865838 RepID=UPI00215F6172|nr:SLOG family protein [Mesorhizobium sp. AR07]UVK46746.1 DUF1273 family protein [Mesorhizobium sp. AR07]